jgi:hypothetical protein
VQESQGGPVALCLSPAIKLAIITIYACCFVMICFSCCAAVCLLLLCRWPSAPAVLKTIHCTDGQGLSSRPTHILRVCSSFRYHAPRLYLRLLLHLLARLAQASSTTRSSLRDIRRSGYVSEPQHARLWYQSSSSWCCSPDLASSCTSICTRRRSLFRRWCVTREKRRSM